MRGVFPRTRIGLERAWRSPGPLYNSQAPVGVSRRVVAGALKLLNLAAAPFDPDGIKVELRQLQLLHRVPLTVDQQYTTREFFRAFSNAKALSFYIETKNYSYPRAIMVHHPGPESLDWFSILSRSKQLTAMIVERLRQLQPYPELLYPLITSMSRKADRKEKIWFPEFDAAYDNYKNNHKLPLRDALLSPFFVGESLADIGCGGGDQLAFSKSRHPELRYATGIDVVDWRTPGLDIDYHVLDFSKPGTVSPVACDTGTILGVLHHVARRDEETKLDTFLQGVKTAVRKRLIVEEDAIITTDDLDLLAGIPEYNSDVNPFLSVLPGESLVDFHLRMRSEVTARVARYHAPVKGMEELFALADQPLFEQYVSLDEQSQRDFTTLNDFLANALSVGVPQMPFRFGFRTIPEWISIFKRNGFALNKVVILGFQPGYFNFACHAYFVLDVKS